MTSSARFSAALLLLVVIVPGCSKNSRSKLPDRTKNNETLSESRNATSQSWTPEQTEQALTSCMQSYGSSLEATGVQIKGLCTCLTDDAKSRWPFTDYIAEVAKYRDRQEKQGVVRSCQEKEGLAAGGPQRSWSEAELAENASGTTHNPVIYKDAKGQPFLLWAQDDGSGNWQVWLQRSQNKNWLKPELVGNNIYNTIEPRAAVATNGFIMVAWPTFVQNNEVMVNTYTPEAGWSGEQGIYASTQGVVQRLNIAMAPDGNACIAWEELLNPGTDAESFSLGRSCYDTQAGWSTAAPLPFSWCPQIHTDGNGLIHAVFATYGEGSTQSAYESTYSFATDTWSTPILIDIASQQGIASFPYDAKVDVSGNLFVAWTRESQVDFSIPVQVWVNRFDKSNKTWGQATQVSQITKDKAVTPKLATLPGGEAFMVWAQYEVSRVLIWGSRFSPDAGWAKPEPLDRDAAYVSGLPEIAANAAGQMLVVWTKKDANDQTNVWSTYFNGKYWEKEVLVENNPLDVTFPRPYLYEDGSGFTIWRQTAGTKDDNWINYFR